MCIHTYMYAQYVVYIIVHIIRTYLHESIRDQNCLYVRLQYII